MQENNIRVIIQSVFLKTIQFSAITIIIIDDTFFVVQTSPTMR